MTFNHPIVVSQGGPAAFDPRAILQKRDNSWHRCRSRQIFGVVRIFAHISPNLPEKNSKQNDLQKNDYTSFHVGHIFLNQGTSSTIFAQISPNLPEKN